METKQIKISLNISLEELHSNIIDATEECLNYADENELVITGTPYQIKLANIKIITKTQRKRITKNILRVRERMTLYNINRLFGSLHDNCLAYNLQVKPSLAEQKAQQLRKLYITSRTTMEAVLKDYKEAKKIAYPKVTNRKKQRIPTVKNV